MSILDRLKKKKVEEGARETAVPVSGTKKAMPKKDAKPAEKKEAAADTAQDAPVHTAAVLGAAAHAILSPLVSEKSVTGEKNGVYIFMVKTDANKIMVKNAMKEMYGVLPANVRMVNMQGKARRFGRTTGKKSDWKKAIVTLPKGQTISIHEGV